MKIIKQEKIIPSHCQGMRFDAALAKIFPEYSRAQLSKWIKLKQVTVDGCTPKATYKVKGIETVTLECQLITQTLLIPQNISLDIKYEDQYLMIVNKPSNMVVHPGAGNPDNTLVNALLFYNRELELLPRAGIVHRLDKDTTGLLIVAKTIESYHALVKLMQDRAIERHYQALVFGDLEQAQTIETFIGRHPTNRIKMSVLKTGKTAKTHLKVLENFNGITHLKLKLETGRTHQIRVHLTHIGHPLVGDQTYTNKNIQKAAYAKLNCTFDFFKRQALHAYKLEFTHPFNDQHICLQQDLPEDFGMLIKKIKELSSNDIKPTSSNT